MSALAKLITDRQKTQIELDKAKADLELKQAALEYKQELLEENLKKQRDIQKYKNEYEHLRKQLTLVESDLKVSYEKYQTSVEPDFLKKRKLEFIVKKLKKLREKRGEVMRLLKREYNVRTKYNNASYKLHQTNSEYINNQSKLIKQNKEDLEKTIDNFRYKNRVIGINDYKVHVIDRKLNIAITGLSFIMVGLVPTVLAFMNLVSVKLAILSIIVLIAVCLVVIYIKYKPVRNRSKRVWELRNFREPEDKKIGPIFEEEEKEVIVEEDKLTIEDVLSSKLQEVTRCKA